MIAGCPTCAARYRIDTAKLPPEGARLRCSRCETVFRVRPPEDVEAAPAQEQRVPTPPAPPASEAAESRGGPRILIAHPERDEGKQVAEAMAARGFDPTLVQDGVEAILEIQRSLPSVVVLDAALPKMFGFQVCELMKRNEQLRSIPVVLVGAIHDHRRYRRSPEELYGADTYLERQQLTDDLPGVLARLGLHGGDAAGPQAPAPQAPAPQAPAPQAPTAQAPAPPVLAAAPDADTAEVEKALRLARIIVSDVILYNQEKFDAALRDGNVVEALSNELEEGYALFAQRVDANVFDPREYLQQELSRVARSRGGAA